MDQKEPHNQIGMEMKKNRRVALALALGTALPFIAMTQATASEANGEHGHWYTPTITVPVTCADSPSTPAWVGNDWEPGATRTKDQIALMQKYDATGKNSEVVCYRDGNVYYLTGKLTKVQMGLEPTTQGAGQWHALTKEVPGEPIWVDDEFEDYRIEELTDYSEWVKERSGSVISTDCTETPVKAPWVKTSSTEPTWLLEGSIYPKWTLVESDDPEWTFVESDDC